VLISNFGEYHRLAAYFFRYTKKMIGVVMGVPTLKELFDEKYYADLSGGILESFGRMFKNDLKLYVYPLLEAKTARSSARPICASRPTCGICTPTWWRTATSRACGITTKKRCRFSRATSCKSFAPATRPGTTMVPPKSPK
jgi:hypothetical protein